MKYCHRLKTAFLFEAFIVVSLNSTLMQQLTNILWSVHCDIRLTSIHYGINGMQINKHCVHTRFKTSTRCQCQSWFLFVPEREWDFMSWLCAAGWKTCWKIKKIFEWQTSTCLCVCKTSFWDETMSNYETFTTDIFGTLSTSGIQALLLPLSTKDILTCGSSVGEGKSEICLSALVSRSWYCARQLPVTE